MPITLEIVRHIAALVRIELSKEEEILFTKQLGDILGYVDSLKEVDTTNVPPTFHPEPFLLQLREDRPGESLPPEIIHNLAPALLGDFIHVPQVLNEGTTTGAPNNAD